MDCVSSSVCGLWVDMKLFGHGAGGGGCFEGFVVLLAVIPFFYLLISILCVMLRLATNYI